MNLKTIIMGARNNKRRNSRTRCLVPIDAKRGGALDRTQTTDISRGGVGFVSRSAIPVAEKIAVELELGPEQNPILVMGQVKWIQADQDTDTYRFGIEFGKLLSGDRARLRKLKG